MLKSWQPLVIDGLLQTEQYARGLLEKHPGMAAEQVDELVAARMARQQILERDRPPLLWVLLDARVLHRPIGTPAIMREQLKALIEMADHPT